jgi:hypothetical protein
MLTMNHDLEGALRTYLSLLEERAYFDAHEVLEEAWHPLRRANHPMKNLLKGLINGAISFEHIERNRVNAEERARKVMKAFDKHKSLAQNAPEYRSLFQSACRKIEALKRERRDIFNISA